MSTTTWIIATAAAAAIGAAATYIINNKKTEKLKRESYELNAELSSQQLVNQQLKEDNDSKEEKIDQLTESLRVASSDLSAQSQRAKTAEEQNAAFKAELEKIREENASLNKELQTVVSQLSAEEQKSKWVEAADKNMREVFGALSKEIVENNSKNFLATANDKLNDFASKLDEKMISENKTVASIMTPVSENLTELKKHIGELETKRATAYVELNKSVDMLKQQSDILAGETKSLNSALRNSSVRGKWGEAQLRRVAELSGMMEHIDFEEQFVNNEGKRPDMVIRLTGGRSIPVDSKVPMDDYLKYAEAADEQERTAHLANHVKAVKKHIDALSKKEYWKSEERSVQMVVLVIPYESGLSAAFEGDPDIFLYAVDKNVLILSPVTFYAFLKSVALGWSEYNLAESAKEIAQLSKELVDRFETFITHFGAVGAGIDKAAASYNKAIGSYNSRLNATFNKIRGLKELPEVPMLDEVTTSVNGVQTETHGE